MDDFLSRFGSVNTASGKANIGKRSMSSNSQNKIQQKLFIDHTSQRYENKNLFGHSTTRLLDNTDHMSADARSFNGNLGSHSNNQSILANE